jgi:hypothetical protein
MEWNLAALATMAASAVAAALLLRRYVRRTSVSLAPVCLRCGAPGAALTSFTCPGCGHNVREAGLGPPRGRSPLGPFWRAAAFTAVFLFLAVFLAGALMSALPPVHKASNFTTMRVASPGVRGVDLFLKGGGLDDRRFNGTLTGDMYAKGGVVTLEVNLPEMRWRLLDLSGAQLDSGERLDGQVIYNWMSRAGVAVDTPVAHSDALHIARAIGRHSRTDLEMPPQSARALSLSFSSSTGGHSSNQPDERALPLIVMAGAALWLAGLWIVLAIPTIRRDR